MSWVQFALNLDEAKLDADAVQVVSDTIPPAKAPFVRSVIHISDTGKYIVNLDPGWLSAMRKSGQDATQALARAGYSGVKL
jgi:hypothetical protein